MWDIPSIESTGVSASQEEERVMRMPIYADEYTWHPNNIFPITL